MYVYGLTDTDRNVVDGFGAMRGVDGFREAVEATRNDLDGDLRERAERRSRSTPALF